jgi:hypothetical protein
MNPVAHRTDLELIDQLDTIVGHQRQALSEGDFNLFALLGVVAVCIASELDDRESGERPNLEVVR